MAWRVAVLHVVAAAVLAVVGWTAERSLLAVGTAAWAAGLSAAAASLRPAHGRRLGRSRAVAGLVAATAVPFAIGVGLAAPALGLPAPLAAAAAVAGAAAVVLVGTAGAAVIRRKRDHQQPRRPAGRRWVTATALVTGLAVPAAPVVGEARAVAGLAARTEPCPDLAFYGAVYDTLRERREFALACDLRRAGPTATTTVDDTTFSVLGPTGAPDTVARLGASAFASHQRLLGVPGTGRELEVIAVPVTGDIRGRAGDGYVLVDSEELRDPDDCALFFATAGVDGVCGAWVVAHEVAHQWFFWTAHRASPSPAALIEGTADYLAWRWWRDTYGSRAAERIAVELFDGRMALARAWVGRHPPAAARPRGMSDSEGRAFTYGRPSAAWIALDRALGPDTAADALFAVFDAGRGASPTVDEVLAAVRNAVPAAEPILRTWWTDPTFEPRL